MKRIESRVARSEKDRSDESPRSENSSYEKIKYRVASNELREYQEPRIRESEKRDQEPSNELRDEKTSNPVL